MKEFRKSCNFPYYHEPHTQILLAFDDDGITVPNLWICGGKPIRAQDPEREASPEGKTDSPRPSGVSLNCKHCPHPLEQHGPDGKCLALVAVDDNENVVERQCVCAGFKEKRELYRDCTNMRNCSICFMYGMCPGHTWMEFRHAYAGNSYGMSGLEATMEIERKMGLLRKVEKPR